MGDPRRMSQMPISDKSLAGVVRRERFHCGRRRELGGVHDSLEWKIARKSGSALEEGRRCAMAKGGIAEQRCQGIVNKIRGEMVFDGGVIDSGGQLR